MKEALRKEILNLFIFVTKMIDNKKPEKFNEIITNAMEKDFVLLRGIRFPCMKNPYSRYNETFIDTELRKLNRVKGFPNRSLTLVAKNNRIFSNIGYGIVKSDAEDITNVNSYDAGSGYGKKPEISTIKDFTNDLRLLRDSIILEKRKDDRICNEITMNIKKSKDISFIFYNIGEVSSREHFDGPDYIDEGMKQLLAIYLKEKLKISNGLELPILRYNQFNGGFDLFNYDENYIVKLIKYTFKNNYEFIKRPDNINIFNIFEKQIKNDKELTNIIKIHLEGLANTKNMHLKFDTNMIPMKMLPQENVNYPMFKMFNILNVAKTLKNFNMQDKSDNLLEVGLKWWINSNKLDNGFVKKAKPSCNHEDIEISNYKNIINEVKKVMSKDSVERNRDLIENTFNNLKDKNIKAR